MIRIVLFFIMLCTTVIPMACSAKTDIKSITVGAEQPEKYLNLLEGKNVAMMVNQTSLVDSTHLVDFLLGEQIKISKIFAVEHGFRGKAANGEEFNDNTDPQTGIPIVSLYNKKKQPDSTDLAGVDIVIYDLQDVGCRFYTYISSLYYLMEACALNNVPLLVLDRPNPNGDYVSGPILDMSLQSFVGIVPVPVVHGCTVGEMAQMMNGEGWLNEKKECRLTVIPVANYTHKDTYSLPVPPSPNLPNDLAIRLYPSLCFFEATNVSIGRGTSFPFQVIGYPGFPNSNFEFTPKSIKGKSTNPQFENETCQGIDLRNLELVPAFTLKYFLQFYDTFADKSEFWKSRRWIDLLSGDPEFFDLVNAGKTENELFSTWKDQLDNYKVIRKKYLLYPDFE